MNNEVTQNDLELDSEFSSESNNTLDNLNNVSTNVLNEDIPQIDLSSNQDEAKETSGEELITASIDSGTSEIEKEIQKPIFRFVDESEMPAKPENSPEIQEEPQVVHEEISIIVEDKITIVEDKITIVEDKITIDEDKITIDETAQDDAVISENITEEQIATNINQENEIQAEAVEVELLLSPEEQIISEEDKKKESEKEAIKTAKQKYFDEIFNELKRKIGKKETVEVEVKARIRGGLRVHYKDIPLFLPTSHLVLKKNPPEELIHSFVGQKFEVYVHEFQEFDQGRKAVIVSRKKILIKEMWEKIQVGDVVEGKVSSVVPFGVFVEFDGLEGLVHVSNLSKKHIDNPKNFFKKGQDIKARIIEINKEKRKIGLSSKEFEESVWKNIGQEFTPGMKVTCTVKRLTEFGAYLEIKPGIDGLLRNNELAWTKRGFQTITMFKVGDKVDVSIVSISEEKESASLSMKRLLPNPWPELIETLKIGSEQEGTVLQVIPQGAVIGMQKDVDGFMPRSKMRNFMRGNRIPFKSGDKLIVIIADINPETQSIILAPKEMVREPEVKQQQERRQPPKPKPANESTFSLGDMLSESEKKKLEGMNS